MNVRQSSGFLALSAASLFIASVAQGAIVSGTFNVTDARLPSLYSGTLDAPCPTPRGTFFSCDPAPAAAAISITPSAGGGGTISLMYDNVTGQVTEITSLDIYVSDMTLVITSFVSGTATVLSDNSFPVVNDFPFLKAGTAGPNGTADADQNPGSITSFQHDAPGTETDAPDFATFSNIVDTCVGTVCSLFPVLNIDAARYEIMGTVGGGAYNGALRAETSSNTNYFVNFTSTETVVPAPAAGWLLLTAVGGLAARRLKKRAACKVNRRPGLM